MKRIVTEVRHKPFYANDPAPLPIVPGTAFLDITIEHEEAGPAYTYNLSARLYQDSVADIRELTTECMLRVTLDDGSIYIIGSEDLPALLSPSRTDTVGISCSWKSPVEPL